MKKIRIVILGGGFGGVSAHRTLHKALKKKKHISLTIISNRDHFLFTPLLHEVATGALAAHDAVLPLHKALEGCKNSTLHIATATRVNTTKQCIETTNGDVPYDYLIMGLGAQTNYFGIAGAKKYCHTYKTLEDALQLGSTVKALSEKKEPARIVVIGGGPTGVEVAASVAEQLKRKKQHHVKVSLIQRGNALLLTYSPKTQARALSALKRLGVDVQLETSVESVQQKSVTLSSGKVLPSDYSLWVAGIAPQTIDYDVNITHDDRCRVHVGNTLQLEEKQNIFVIGDMAFCEGSPEPLPATAQVAEAQGRHAAQNILAYIRKQPLAPFHFKSKGMLVSFGFSCAAAEIGKLKLSGTLTSLLWHGMYLMKLHGTRRKLRVLWGWIKTCLSTR